ncbi:MAG: hypothetical protein QXQ57_00775 [Sulfolobales archaeon]
MYREVSVKSAGRLYTSCVVEIADGSRVKISCRERRRFGRGAQTMIEKSPWDLRSRDGREVLLGDLVVIFNSDDDACRFVGELLSITYERVIGEAEKALANYLGERSKVLEILSRLRRSPRSTLLSFIDALKNCQKDPLECISEDLLKGWRSTYSGFSEKLRNIISGVSEDISGKILSAVYLIASLQLKIYEGDSATASKILDLIESEHGYSVDRAVVGRIASQQDYRGADEFLMTTISNIFNRIKISIYMRYGCRPSESGLL